MTIKTTLLLICIIFSGKSFSQVTTSVIENKPKETVEKVYDGISNIEEHRNTEDYKQYIGYEIYSTGSNRNFYDSIGKFTSIQKGYFLIKDFTKFDLIDAGDHKNSDEPVLEVEDKETKKTYYLSLNYFNLKGLVFVPYFLSQKEAYDNKKFIIISSRNHFYDATIPIHSRSFQNRNEVSKFYGGEWTCEVSVVDNAMSYILRNDLGDIITYEKIGKDFNITKNIYDTRTNMNFMLVDDYNSELKRLQKEKNDIVAQNEKLEVLSLNKLIQKYGKEKANLISKGEVEIGMTRQMCIDSWGVPLFTNITKTQEVEKETLTYSWKKTLYLNNGVLTKFEY